MNGEKNRHYLLFLFVFLIGTTILSGCLGITKHDYSYVLGGRKIGEVHNLSIIVPLPYSTGGVFEFPDEMVIDTEHGKMLRVVIPDNESSFRKEWRKDVKYEVNVKEISPDKGPILIPRINESRVWRGEGPNRKQWSSFKTYVKASYDGNGSVRFGIMLNGGNSVFMGGLWFNEETGDHTIDSSQKDKWVAVGVERTYWGH